MIVDFKGKKVLIMGLGQYKEGSGISAAKFFITCGARVTITDLKTDKELGGQVKSLKKFYQRIRNKELGIKKFFRPDFVLGKHRIDDFKSADIVVRNPGVRADSPYLEVARDAGAEILSDINIFLSLAPGSVVGVTGTRGKSTTSALLHQMLKTKEKHAELGGNILRSPLNFLDKMHEGSAAVLELSSWQCESLKEIKKSPHIAVITNIMRDHLNTYKGMADYAAAKILIYKYQSPEDAVVLNRDNGWTRAMGQKVPSKRFWFSAAFFAEENGVFIKTGKIIFRLNGKEELVARASDLALLGGHNLQNALAAIAAAKIMGVGNAFIKNVLKNFKGLPNRTEKIKEVKGVKFINDTTATTPDATMAALQTFGKGKNIVLIFGGADKKLEYGDVAPLIKKFVKTIVLLPGTALVKIKTALLGQKVLEAKNMSEAVKLAFKFAKKGDFILLSPGAASFGLFKNEFERGEKFVKAVKTLRKV